MRLLLDEHYSPAIAEQLRQRGHDVVAVKERPGLVGLEDAELFSLAQAERRAILTENWADYQRLRTAAEEAGTHYYGVVLTSRRQLPRGKDTIGLYVRVLDEFLTRHPADDAIANSCRWVP